MSDEKEAPGSVVTTTPGQEGGSSAPAGGESDRTPKSLVDEVMERVAKNAEGETPKPDAKKPEVDPKKDTPPVNAAEVAVIAERKKWQKRESKTEAKMNEMETLIRSLMEKVEAKATVTPGGNKQDDSDTYIRENKDDPLVKRLLATEARLAENESRQAEHGSYIDKVKDGEASRWVDASEKDIETKYKPLIPEAWKENEDGTPNKYNKFLSWVVMDENKWVWRSPETMDAAFRQFFYDDILSAKVSEARDEALKRKADAAQAGINPPQQAAGTPSAFGKNKSYQDEVMERHAAMTGG